MTAQLIITILGVYFAALLLIAWFTSRNADSDAFFTGNNQSAWYLVAFGMIGTSVSGVTFISVPGQVAAQGFSYFQLILGNMFGYFVVAAVLMPIYYKSNMVSIYTFLEERFGFWSYKTGSAFFLLSRTIGSSLRLYLAAEVLHTFLFRELGVSFIVTVGVTILLIWVYTFKGGVKTIIWTDTFQTFFLVGAVIISVVVISNQLGWGTVEMIKEVDASKYSTIFHFEDIKSPQYFWKQFISGIFMTIVLTGLDQDLMQKNLTCKNLGEAQKNMYWFSVILVAVNFLFLTLGALLYIYADQKGIAVPAQSDFFYPILALKYLGVIAGVFFLLGITASSYASSDSALTALTTAFCIDFLNFNKGNVVNKNRTRTYVHIGFSMLFFVIIVLFKEFNEGTTVIKTVLKAAAYTYGPLLGMFAFGIFSKHRTVTDRWVPVVCIVSPLLTFLVVLFIKEVLGYQTAFEDLLINGAITIIGLLCISHAPKQRDAFS
ncbi:sodium:solute symporter [Cytophaga hutchinsonii]|uniref:Sodium/solute symporter n=1 Tax=Cytophaga hutchinsonii (strain ATCC 33406 / DSM 1761 / CIP 103989 / NBRC 15051 / NCIMB 9469 / D465) TaxID=269798 RepID=A0A6N4SPQ4_CYTH3|nr:sodium:solute symporter [Cytophaga hutchinsonii]ABG58324.1 sodium/solute symporter [Cytophaga hutchinsonii ATCC 33406]SFX52516.1 Na+/proline symporter [Cytophaga hutchinsonii ATCC 33406]